MSESLREQIERAQRDRDEAIHVLNAVWAAVKGEPVSDFEESFQQVRDAVDLRAERDRLRTALNQVGTCYDCGRMVFPIQVNLLDVMAAMRELGG